MHPRREYFTYAVPHVDPVVFLTSAEPRCVRSLGAVLTILDENLKGAETEMR